MPVRNGTKFIRRAIDSLLAQTYTNFELIISDNDSNDGTWELVQGYAGRDMRIKLYRQVTNIHSYRNFSFVLSKAEGKYFMWAAVDDLWLPEFIDSMVAELQTHTDAGVAMCAVERRYEDGIFKDLIRFEGKNNPVNKTYYGMIKGLTSPLKYNLYLYGLYRTVLLRKATRYYPEFWGADRMLVCQIALATRFRYVDSILHIRTNHRLPSYLRLPQEKFNKMLREDRLMRAKRIISFSKMLAKSNVIPVKRKFYIPATIFRYAKYTTKDRIIARLAQIGRHMRVKDIIKLEQLRKLFKRIRTTGK